MIVRGLLLNLGEEVLLLLWWWGRGLCLDGVFDVVVVVHRVSDSADIGVRDKGIEVDLRRQIQRGQLGRLLLRLGLVLLSNLAVLLQDYAVIHIVQDVIRLLMLCVVVLVMYGIQGLVMCCGGWCCWPRGAVVHVVEVEC